MTSRARVVKAGRIAVLEAKVISQIAAGEVVERPASVVKELVENALDAGARAIEIDLHDGGRRRIRVVDDGCGMSREEVELALQRHATSKLREVDDLEQIDTIGFRGEGLSSVAAVSRLVLHARRPEEEVGWRVRAVAGEIVERQPAARRAGTAITVEDLFFNTPGRLKFLKSTAAETAHVVDIVNRLACGFINVRLALVHGGRSVLSLPCAESRLERARAVLGRRARRLCAMSRREEGIAVEACLAPPEETLSSARQLLVLVNGRPVVDRPLLSAVLGGYGELLAGRYPMGAVFVDVDPRAVDVNVHPQKREVRFREQREVCAAVRRCVADGVAASPWEGAASQGRTYQLARPAEPPAEREDRLDRQRRMQSAARRFWSAQLDGGRRAADVGEAVGYGQPAAAPEDGGDYEVPGELAKLRVLGQAVDGALLVCEDRRGLVLIDVEAARGQLALARLRSELEAGSRVPAQRLLVPASVELTAAESAVLEQHADLVARLGLDVEPFGGDTWSVRGVPQPLQDASPAELVRELVAALADPRSGRRQLDRALAQLALAAASADRTEVRSRELLAEMDRAGIGLDDGVAMALTPEVRASGRPSSGERIAVIRIDRLRLERGFALAATAVGIAGEGGER